MAKRNRMKGLVETYITDFGDMVITAPLPGTDWPRLKSLPHDEALAVLLELQLASGYSVIRPEEIGALTDGMIIGWHVTRDESGKYLDAEHIWWHEDYRVQDAIKELMQGNAVVFKNGDDEKAIMDMGKYREREI